MASENKKNKLKNSYLSGGMLKNASTKLKRIAFFTPSNRKIDKKIDFKEEQ